MWLTAQNFISGTLTMIKFKEGAVVFFFASPQRVPHPSGYCG